MREPLWPAQASLVLLFPCRACPSWQDKLSSLKATPAEVKIQGGSVLREFGAGCWILGSSELVHSLLSSCEFPIGLVFSSGWCTRRGYCEPFLMCGRAPLVGACEQGRGCVSLPARPPKCSGQRWPSCQCLRWSVLFSLGLQVAFLRACWAALHQGCLVGTSFLSFLGKNCS